VIALPPIHFDRTSGSLEGANLWERTAALALTTGSKISSHFSHRGYNGCANLLRKTLPERNIAVRLNADAVFEFPYGDGYWSKLLNRSYSYEDELELLLRHAAGIDYTLLDCGANYGYWSVLASSAPFGSHRAIAIEPSSENLAKLANNARVNNNRFEPYLDSNSRQVRIWADLDELKEGQSFEQLGLVPGATATMVVYPKP